MISLKSYTLTHSQCILQKDSDLVIVAHRKTYSNYDAPPVGNGELCERSASIIQFALSYVLSLFKATYLLFVIICQLYQT